MKAKVNKIKKVIRSLVFPSHCPMCDEIQETEGFCRSCAKKIVYVKEPVCKRCGKMLHEMQQEYCFDCKKKIHYFTQGKGVYLYTGDMKLSMYRFKYSNARHYARIYARDAVKQYGKWLEQIKPQVILPVPMYDRKKQQRGYNQAEVVAREISRLTGIPMEGNLVRRVRNTRPQKEVSGNLRQNNLKKAFKITKNTLQLKKVLLIDDIYTTGSTMDAMAEVLRQAGVEEVYYICICIGKGF